MLDVLRRGLPGLELPLRCGMLRSKPKAALDGLCVPLPLARPPCLSPALNFFSVTAYF